MARKSDKAYYLKRLFETQLVKTVPEASPETRQDQAARIMDDLVGPRWRTEVNADMELVPDLETIPNAQEVEEFWGKVQQAGYDAGFGTEEVEHDVPQDQDDMEHCCPVPEHSPRDQSILAKIRTLLGL